MTNILARLGVTFWGCASLAALILVRAISAIVVKHAMAPSLTEYARQAGRI